MPEPVQVLIAEKSPSLAGLLAGLLAQANYTVAVATTVDEALAAVRERGPLVVLSSVSRFDGEGLCKTLRKQRAELAVALIYPPSRDDDVEARARMFGADLVLVGPVQGPAVLSAVRLLIRMRRLSEQVAAAARPPQLEGGDDGPQPLDLPTFKRMLQNDVRKSRRYKFPAAFLLIQLDAEPLRARGLSRPAHAKLVGGVLATLTQALRDIDLCVHTGSDRFIIFLPHTPEAGARIVASRLHARVAGSADPALACSVGVAAYDGRGPVSFGSLLKEATLALKRAKTTGGNRVEQAPAKRRDRVFIA